MAWIFAATLSAAFGAWACSSSSSVDGAGSGTDAGGASDVDGATAPSPSSTAGGADSGSGGKPGVDSGAGGASDAGALPDGATYRTSLRVCWNDPSCTRALAISHGGDWNLVSGPPYDSNAALAAAYTNGADGVKIDVRFTSDNIAVISHSSPIQTYESLDCSGKYIEQMTAAQVTACTRFPSSEKFQLLDDVLDALRGKVVIQLCVKVNTDFARTIQDVLKKGAEDYAFIEANVGDFPAIVPLPNANQLYYVVNVGTTVADIDTVIAFKNPRIIMLEIDPSVALNGMAASKIRPAGAHAFTYDNSSTATSATLKALFDQGYDVVSSNLTAPDVQARIQVNTGRGVSPP